MWVCRLGPITDNAHHFPVPGHRILACRCLPQTPIKTDWSRVRRYSFDGGEVAEAQAPEVRQMHAANGPCRVAKGVGAFVAVDSRVGPGATTDAIKHDDRYTPGLPRTLQVHARIRASTSSRLVSMSSWV